MMNFDVQTLESDLHRLDCSFASLRIQQPRVVDRLARSIEHNGQLVPLVAVAEQSDRWVLIDGYQRIEALRRLSRDTARIELWDCPLSDGRDVSWINRRLSLVGNLPEALFSAICQGELSSWAASRVLAPLARANNDHAMTLLASLQREPLSTRELHTWYQHYQKANHLKRQRMLDQPRLFCEALQAKTREQQAVALRAGPEGAWLAELKRVRYRLRGLQQQLPLVFADIPESAPLQRVWTETKTLFYDLDATLTRMTQHDHSGNPTGDSRPASQEDSCTQDRQAIEDLTQHRAPGDSPAISQGGTGTADAGSSPGADQIRLCTL